MWADLLVDDDLTLFRDGYDAALKFGPLLTFDLDAGIHDENWVPLEEDEALETGDVAPGFFDED